MKESRTEKRSSSSRSSKGGGSASLGVAGNVRVDQTSAMVGGKEAAGGNINTLEKFAGWVSSGLHTAFFISMDRCACVKLETLDEPILLRRPLLLSPPFNPSSKPHVSSSNPSLITPFNARDRHSQRIRAISSSSSSS